MPLAFAVDVDRSEAEVLRSNDDGGLSPVLSLYWISSYLSLALIEWLLSFTTEGNRTIFVEDPNAIVGAEFILREVRDVDVS